MNASGEKSLDPYRSFQLLATIEQEELLSQRELAGRLGIAVGLVNSYLKNLVAKGYVRIRAFPRNRYAYLLTTQGIAEKSRLAYQHLTYFTNLYTVARKDYLQLFRRLEASGVQSVAFCGMDEVAEIAYLSLRETELRLVAVLDDVRQGSDFFGVKVQAIAEGVASGDFPIVITSLKRHELFMEVLNAFDVDVERVLTINKVVSADCEFSN